MRAWIMIPALILLSLPATAQKPWETRVDLPVAIPIELPAVPATNPFATAVVATAVPVATPLVAKYVTGASVQAAAYVDSTGLCQRVVLLRVPYPGMARELQAALEQTSFTPGKSFAAAVATWLPVAFDLDGRVEKGQVLSLQVMPPDPTSPPVVEASPTPSPDARDVARPAVSAEKLDQLPVPKRFKVRLDERTWRQEVRLLVEVSPAGRVTRAVFLSCPDGLRRWLLHSMAGWSFRPAQGADGAITAWLGVELALQVELSDQDSDALRVSRQTVYPAAAAPAGALPPGA